MQLKDLDTKRILEVFARHQGRWAFWEQGTTFLWFNEESDKILYKETPIILRDGKVFTARLPDFSFAKEAIKSMDTETIFDFPIPHRLWKKKMEKLVKKKLLGGCSCWCRGDFEITDKGLALIGKDRTKPYSGY